MEKLPFNQSGLNEKIQKNAVVLSKDAMNKIWGGDGNGSGTIDPPPEEDD